MVPSWASKIVTEPSIDPASRYGLLSMRNGLLSGLLHGSVYTCACAAQAEVVPLVDVKIKRKHPSPRQLLYPEQIAVKCDELDLAISCKVLTIKSCANPHLGQGSGEVY